MLKFEVTSRWTGAVQRVACNNWCDDWQRECAGGIHFFITRIEAENY